MSDEPQRFRLADLTHVELVSKSGEKYSLSAVVSEAMGFQGVFVHHDVIPPGRRASAPHFHTRREEMLLVLEGHPTAVHGERRIELGPGDAIGFLPGDERPHVVENTSKADARVLTIASNPPDDRVIS